jgi:hypothetical protein
MVSMNPEPEPEPSIDSAILAFLRDRGYSGKIEVARSLRNQTYTVLLGGEARPSAMEPLSTEVSARFGRQITILTRAGQEK